MYGILTGETIEDEADELDELAELEAASTAPVPTGELERPPWLRAVNEDARRRSDHFRVA